MQIGNRCAPIPPPAHSPSYLFSDPDDVAAAGEMGGPPKSPLMAGVSSAFSLVRKVSKKVSKPKQGRIEGTDKIILDDVRAKHHFEDAWFLV